MAASGESTDGQEPIPSAPRPPDTADASILDDSGEKVLVSASTVEQEVRAQLAGRQGRGGNASAAALVGKRLAEKALAAGIESVAFDRSGYRFHGRVKALAEAAREAGLKF